MSINAVGYNPFDYDPRQVQSAGKVGAYGGAAVGSSGGSGQGQPLGLQERELDPNMLAQKAQGFQNGLGGTNNPDGHKIFFAA